MQGLPAIVSFQAPGTEAQRRWLQCTRIPLASIIFGPSGGPHPDEGGLARLPLVDATCLTASERTLLSITASKHSQRRQSSLRCSPGASRPCRCCVSTFQQTAATWLYARSREA